jgi:hypothetical protein
MWCGQRDDFRPTRPAPLTFKRVAIDLAGRNVLAMSVLPKVIETPRTSLPPAGRHPADSGVARA